MKPENILKSNILDLIFENRNKDYGAYELRKNYQSRMYRALGITALVVLILGVAQSFKVPKKSATVYTELLTGAKITNVELPKEKQEIKKEPAKKVQIKNAATASYTKPVVVPDNKADKPMSTIDKVENSLIDDTEKDGDKVTTEVNITKDPPTDGNGTGNEKTITEPEKNEPEIFVTSEIMPEFPGGREAFINFLQKNLRQPNDFDEGQKLVVIASFVVNANGEIEQINIMQHGREDLDNEVIRVIKKMPRWKAGVQNGRNVAVYYKIPITFVAPE